MTTTELRSPDWRTQGAGHVRRIADGIRGRAVALARRARSWRVTLAMPGITGAAMISVGAGLKLGLWAGLIVGGLFALRIDGRI